ncbi:hypothetical protein [Ralstonia sp. A12]|uniref:hypothetical protein n=1 Tax=Ralstonia sp. A12 TaxID=1217052 RepID=UPI0012EE9E69|nr:hypothetical protein [Ralstonia sp. A12]
MTDHPDQLGTSAAVPADQQHDEWHSSAAEWPLNVLDGTKQVHENEDECHGVDRRTFERASPSAGAQTGEEQP